jgi:hypothetical protein
MEVFGGLWEPFLFDELLWIRSPEAGYEYYVHSSQPTWSWLRLDQAALNWYYKDPHSVTILASVKVADEGVVPAVLKISFRLKVDFQEGIFDDDSVSAQRGYVEDLGKVHRYICYPEMQYDTARNLEWIPFRYYDCRCTSNTEHSTSLDVGAVVFLVIVVFLKFLES